jgi:DnaJ family protein A protein 2
MSSRKDFYKILDINETSSVEEIKTAYRKKALLAHPDRGGNSEEFNKINTAYENLVNNNPHPQDFFNNIFGDIIKQLVFQKHKSPAIVYTHKVTLEDICTRKIIKLKVSLTKFCNCVDTKYKTCRKCEGKGYVSVLKNFGILSQKVNEECNECFSECKHYIGCQSCQEGIFLKDKVFEIYLNPELGNGYNYIFKNEGNQTKGRTQGDFIVNIEYIKHPVFHLQNKDLIMSKDISLKEALCGYDFDVIHPKKEIININSRLITIPGMFLKIDGKGLTQEGKLTINFNIIFPDTLSLEQKELLKSIL